MAEINKLSAGKVLDKLRRNDAPKISKLMRRDEKAEPTTCRLCRVHQERQRYWPFAGPEVPNIAASILSGGHCSTRARSHEHRTPCAEFHAGTAGLVER